MNTTNTEGVLEQAKGKVKQALGETFGNEKLANEGVTDQLKGHAAEAWGNVKDAANEFRTSHEETMHTETEAHGDSLRDKVTHAAESAKDSINRGLDHLKHRP
jgi:uncharacterized protein YjbJ (UPF0337 family)